MPRCSFIRSSGQNKNGPFILYRSISFIKA